MVVVQIGHKRALIPLRSERSIQQGIDSFRVRLAGVIGHLGGRADASRHSGHARRGRQSISEPGP
jgi:hypothetical protein